MLNPYLIKARAIYLANQCGLYGWKIVLTDDSVNAGVCRPEKRTIELSRCFMNDEAYTLDTILHEICHAQRVTHHHSEGFEQELAALKTRFGN